MSSADILKAAGLLTLIVAAVVIFRKAGGDDDLFAAAPGRVCENLTAAEARAWLSAHPEAQILDVRTPGEFADGALPGAVNLPVGADDFDQRALRLDRDRPVFVYCASGMRSRRALARLQALDFKELRHLDGGYRSW